MVKAAQAYHSNKYEKAIELAEKALTIPTTTYADDHRAALTILSNSYTRIGKYLIGYEFAIDLVDREARDKPGGKRWASSVVTAFEARRQATCKGDIFCDCDVCAALPEKPKWMSSPQVLVATAERVVAVTPTASDAWLMHANAHVEIEDMATAARSFTRSAKFLPDADGRNADFKALIESKARMCLEHATAIANTAFLQLLAAEKSEWSDW